MPVPSIKHVDGAYIGKNKVSHFKDLVYDWERTYNDALSDLCPFNMCLPTIHKVTGSLVWSQSAIGVWSQTAIDLV